MRVTHWLGLYKVCSVMFFIYLEISNYRSSVHCLLYHPMFHSTKYYNINFQASLMSTATNPFPTATFAMKSKKMFCFFVVLSKFIQIVRRFSLKTWSDQFTGFYSVFSTLSRWFYPQYITWNWVSLRPELTPKRKLFPWLFLSVVVLSITLSFFYIGFREILVYEKDPDFSPVHVLFLVIYTGAASIASASILTFLLEGNEIIFELGNLLAIGTHGMINSTYL